MKNPIALLERMVVVHETAATRLRQAIALLEEAGQRSRPTLLSVDPSAATDPRKPVIRELPRADSYENLAPSEAAAAYIDSVRRPVMLSELFRALMDGGIRGISRSSLLSSLNHDKRLAHIKTMGWVTSTVRVSGSQANGEDRQ